jgi:hypothetical protein
LPDNSCRERSRSLPGDDEDQQQRYAVDQVQIAGQRRRLRLTLLGSLSSSTKYFRIPAIIGLRRGEDHVAQQADREHAEKGPQIAEQAKIDRSPSGLSVALAPAAYVKAEAQMAKAQL